MSRKFFLTLFVCLLIMVNGNLRAQTQSNQTRFPIVLFSTGMDDKRNLLTPGLPDPHYILISRPGKDAIQAKAYAAEKQSPWSAHGPNSNWLMPEDSGASGNFVLRTTFDLSGYEASTAVITGTWAVDDDGKDILINGVSAGCSAPDGKSVGGSKPFAQYSNPFKITSGFVSGIKQTAYSFKRTTG